MLKKNHAISSQQVEISPNTRRVIPLLKINHVTTSETATPSTCLGFNNKRPGSKREPEHIFPEN